MSDLVKPHDHIRQPMKPGGDTGEGYTQQQPRIADRCPTCKGQTLFIGSGGWLTCSFIPCPRPALEQSMEELYRRVEALQSALDVAEKALESAEFALVHLMPGGHNDFAEHEACAVCEVRAALASLTKRTKP